MTGKPEAGGPRAIGEIASYHAHIYYDPATTRAEAEQLRTLDRRALLGHARTVARRQGRSARPGHVPGGLFRGIFPELVPWLMLNHGRLSVLVHPNTTNPRRDHLADPIWIGPALDVHGDKLPEHSELEQAPAPNTNPVLRP